MAKIALDSETIDNITILGLKEHRTYLRDSIKQHKKGTQKLHPEDLAYDIDMIEHFNKVLEYYGGK